jgi:hypothetical protein
LKTRPKWAEKRFPHGWAWSERENDYLRKQSGKDVRDVARFLGRSVHAVLNQRALLNAASSCSSKIGFRNNRDVEVTESASLKRCTRCEKDFPATTEFFKKQIGAKHDLSYACKVCLSAQEAQWRQDNIDEVRRKERIKGAAWRAENPEKRRATVNAYNARRKQKSPLMRIWAQMIQRCTNPNSASWKHYGGANPPVQVCSRWRNSYEAFAEDMGPRPTLQHTLGRFGDVGNYEPGNCAWQTWAEQGLTKRTKNLLNSNPATQISAAA